MTHKIATVSETIHYGKTGRWREVVLDCAQTHERSIPLDSPQWFAWLEAPENSGFSYALHNHAKGYINGFMTVRKERRQRGGVYWSAYRRQGRRLRKIYLGPSASVTEARLHEVAARLYTGEDPCDIPTSAPSAAGG
jgi:LuxR family maltose regulon positive regulatory protein